MSQGRPAGHPAPGGEVSAADPPRLQERHVHLPKVHREQDRQGGRRLEGPPHLSRLQVSDAQVE